MTSTYAFEFERNDARIKVYFIDEDATIEKAESLAQIGHFYRRSWAVNLISVMETAHVATFQYLLADIQYKCPFEKRLVDENWTKPFVVLTKLDAHYALYVYRLVYFYFFMRISFLPMP